MRPVRAAALCRALALSAFLGLAAACRPACDSIQCQHGGICQEADTRCECPRGYTGNRCQQLDAAQLAGQYAAAYSGCFAVTGQPQVWLEVLTDSLLRLRNLGDYACASGTPMLDLRIEGGMLRLRPQRVCAAPGFEGYLFVGSGSRLGDGLELHFSATYAVGTATQKDSCRVILTPL